MKRRRIILALVFCVAILVSLIWYLSRTAANNKDVALQTALVQNGIIIDSVQFISSNAPVSGSQHQAIVTALTANLDQLQGMSSKRFNDTQVAQLKQLVKYEEYALSIYKKDLDILSKVLTYNPADDLGGAVSASQVAARANAASDGMNQVLQKDIGQKLTIVPDEISLSADAHASLASAKNCFARLGNGTEPPGTCIKLYATTRHKLNDNLAQIWNSSDMRAARQSARNLLTYLRQPVE